jgi:hypothetical protein
MRTGLAAGPGWGSPILTARLPPRAPRLHISRAPPGNPRRSTTAPPGGHTARRTTHGRATTTGARQPLTATTTRTRTAVLVDPGDDRLSA